MTGAGSAELAAVHEDSLGTLPGSPTYWEFGRDPSLSDAELSNTLARLRTPRNEEAVESLKQNLEGAVEVEAVISSDVQGEVHTLVFNDGGSGFTSGRLNSATIYAGVDYLDGTAERQLTGCIPLEYSVTYEQGSPCTFTATMGYQTETLNTSITPSSITTVSDGTSVAHHGASLTVDSVTLSKLQSATLSISNIGRYQRGPSAEPVDAVLAAPETTLDFEAIITGPDRLEIAYGAADATEPQDQMSAVSGSFAFADGGSTTAADYTLSQIKPDTYTWNALVDAEEDTTESISAHVNGGISVS